MTPPRRSLPSVDGLSVRDSDRRRLAHDASHYLLVPQGVVVARDADHVGRVLRAVATAGATLTFRSGGTSLSGQAVTDGLLVDTRRHFGSIAVQDDGHRVTVGPGAVLRAVNARLAPYGRRLGPDPASEAACTVGGVLANNSSGMTCGTEANSYRTVESVVVVLASGTVVDTSGGDADARLRAAAPDIHAGLLRLRDRVRGNPASVRNVREQFAMKNTMGYGLNAFLDHDDPARILTHLLVGSEGTLAFVARATFRTVPVRPHAATSLLVLDDLGSATASLPTLLAAAPAAIELMDAASLLVAQGDPRAPAELRDIEVTRHAALLVEWQAPDADSLAAALAAAGPVLADLRVTGPWEPSADPARRAGLWRVRKGLYAAVAATRPPGTTALLEDVAVPVAALADTCEDLTALVARHGYDGTVIFGHARDGNIHFMLTERFGEPGAVARYEAFTEDMVEAVLSRGGTLKAEHGTGRVMAPFVRRQYGDELYDVMREVKRLLDPAGVLNPGVIIGDDPRAHLRHLKVIPTVEPEVDRCTECGYCEPVCPSRDLTTTPRQRIVLQREIAVARAAGDRTLADRLRHDRRHDVVETCAVDGMCQVACPVGINTGDLVKRLRAEARSTGPAAALGAAAAGAWGPVVRAAGLTLDAARAVPAALPAAASRAVRAVAGAEAVPRWDPDLPGGGRPRRPVPLDQPDAVFVPSCQNTMFGPAGTAPGVGAAVLALADRAGRRLAVPEGIAGMCCGTPWSSKGLTAGRERMAGRVRPWLAAATRDGELPVVSDAASCTEGWASTVAGSHVRVVDVVEWIVGEVLPRVTVAVRFRSLALHPTCSSVRAGLDDPLRRIARAVADEVVVPEGWGCCGFAGDRGLLHPDLTVAATREEAATVSAREFDAYASVNRACEIGLTRATGRPYVHIVELLERATRGARP